MAMRKQQITSYLLGELSEEDREDFERDYFESNDFAAEVLAAEEKLMEEYVSGILDARRREQFESIYLSNPSQRQELDLHRSLRSLGSPASSKPTRRTVQRIAIAGIAACIAFFAAGLLLVFRENRQLRNDIQNVQSAQKQLMQHNDVPAPAPHEQPPAEIPSTTPAILLIPGIREASSAIPVIRLSKDTAYYLLQAEVAANANTTYRAIIQNVEGSTLFEAGPLKPIPEKNGHVRIQLYVSSNQLNQGDYILLLQDIATHRNAGEYYFRLLK